MKKKLTIIVLIIILAIIIVAGGTIAIIKSKNNNVAANKTSNNVVNTSNIKHLKTANISKKKELNAVPKILADQGNVGITTIDGQKFNTLTVGSGSYQTVATFPNAGTKLTGITNKFEKAAVGQTYSVGPGFKATYNGKNGWMVTFNGKKNPYSKHVTTDLVPQCIKMSDTTGYLYVPASSPSNQGFLMGYNLNDDSPFNWEVHINGTSTTVPRLNSFNLNGLMQNSDYGFYANQAGILYIFDNTYTMTLQSTQYPDMKFIFNTGAKNNIEPVANMGYYNDSMSKMPVANNNVPIIYPVSSSTGYIYQKPTDNADGYIWFFNTNWNGKAPLNANGIVIPKGNFSNPIYSSSNNSVEIPAYNGVKGITAVPNNDFNGNYVNPTSNSNGAASIQIIVKDQNGNPVAGQSFNVLNKSGQYVAKNVTTDNNGQITLYGLAADYYVVQSANENSGTFTINEVVLGNGEGAAVANLVYNNGILSAPANLNSTQGTITVSVPSGGGVNLYQDGQFMQSGQDNGNGQVVFNNVDNGLYTVAGTSNGYINSAQYEVGLNSGNENATFEFHKVNSLTTGNMFAEAEDSNGNPVSGITFELSQNGEVLETQTTGQSGTVNFDNEPFGEYTITNTSTGNSQQASISNSNYTNWSYFTNQ